jgi:hypothetical protein
VKWFIKYFSCGVVEHHKIDGYDLLRVEAKILIQAIESWLETL